MINRYIYVYRHNGVPIYVGSSGNPKKRDTEHVKRNRVPFDRLMTKLGRENFVFEVVETVIGETVVNAFIKAVPRENFWMNKLKTWHEYGTGGQNFMRAAVVYSDEEQRVAAVVAQAVGVRRRSQNTAWQSAQWPTGKKRPQEWVMKHTDGLKRRSQNSGWRTASAAANKVKAQDLAWQKAQKAGVRSAWQDLEFAEERLKQLAAVKQTSEYQAAKAVGIKARTQSVALKHLNTLNALTEANGGIRPKSIWLQMNGYSGLRSFLQRHPEYFDKSPAVVG